MTALTVLVFEFNIDVPFLLFVLNVNYWAVAKACENIGLTFSKVCQFSHEDFALRWFIHDQREIFTTLEVWF